MEILSQLSKITAKSQKRVGRGYGSGVGGHTTGRGAKGDNVRGKTKLTFDGTKIKKSWIKRLPFLRGKHRLLAKNDQVVFGLAQLEKWYQAGEVVDLNTLSQKAGFSPTAKTTVKILANGELTKSLTFKGVKLTQSALAKIQTVGGKIES
jgi:large subunit ribosomal protein L15